jgi:predicted nucleotide-binding protein (sugar kinase/HSP70/actin superfamily)
MDSIAGDFKTIEIDYSLQKPRIGVIGEIYVRSHPFANNNIIERLEKLGAVCDLASLAEWIYYTNLVRSNKARRNGHYKSLFVNKTMNHFQLKIERKLAEPLEAKFGKLAEDPVEHVISLAEPFIDQTFEGEAVLSVGKTIEYYQQGLGGVVNVMPFTCMPSTIVSTQTMQISAVCDDMPILNITFDGQEDSILPTRLEAFVAQVTQRQNYITTAEKMLVC